MSPANDWNEWRQHVLAQLTQQRDDHREVREALQRIQVEIAQLKVRAGLWGAVAGVIPAIAVLLWRLL